jgi:hypothetical protein
MLWSAFMNEARFEKSVVSLEVTKISYEKPSIVTFGSVSKLTLGSGGSLADGGSVGKRK